MMIRKEAILELSRYFSIKELVCDHTYKRFGESSWNFIPTFWLETLLVLRRDILKTGMICNNYSSPNGIYTQRGCRCNLCQLVQDETKKSNCYQSAHTKNIANDFTVQGMRTEQARQKIIANKHLLPYPVRLEKDVKWLHIDGYDINNGEKITMFTG